MAPTHGPVEAVLFDLDGTLVEYERSPDEVLAMAFERAGVEPFFPVEAYYDRFEAYLDRADPGEDFRAACFADIAADYGRDPAVGRRVAEAYAAIRDPHGVRRLPGVADALDALEGLPWALVTNGPPDYQEPKLEAADLAGRFETVVFAGTDTAAKPAAEPFERALGALGVSPDRAVMVGNSHDADVAGAAGVGLRTVLVANAPPESSPDPDHVIASPAGLAPPPWRG